jgi:uncharacterized protein YdhG (YjbR/CyaY superfamily)
MSDVEKMVDEYIAGFPPDVQAILRRVRATVRAAAPQAEERISYRMPALFQDGVLVYYAAFKRHIGLYPPVQDAALRAEAEPYAGPKGNLQFPYSEPVPYDLVARIVKSRLRDNLARTSARRPAKSTDPAKRAAR